MTKWVCKHFNDLTADELYSILQLRNEIFVIEQKCIYQDADGKDENAFHVMGVNSQDKLIAYGRILPANVSYPEVSIGRVITHRNERKKGIGKLLMSEIMQNIVKLHGHVNVRISAQSYLIPFYKSFGFNIVGKEYLEDNIPHHEMLYTSSRNL